MARQGKQNEGEFARALRSYAAAHAGFWWRRWPDHRDWVVLNKKLRAPRAPCDFVALYNGRFYALELKSTRGKYFLHAWMKDHQMETLKALQECGGASYLVFMHRRPRVRCWAIPIDNYLKVRDAFSRAGRKSVPVDAMSEIGVPIPRLRGSFNLAPLFEREPPKMVRGVMVK